MQIRSKVGEIETYTSKARNYKLNPAEIFSVVDDLEAYVRKANYGNPVPSDLAWLDGNGRRLTISTRIVKIIGEQRHLMPINLAELVLLSHNSLTLKVNGHTEVAVPSKELHRIGKKYQI